VILLFLVALVVTFGTRREIKRTQRLRLIGTKARGRVIGQKFKLRFNRSSTYHALIVFETLEGNAVQIECGSGLSIPSLQTGSTVTVVYEAANPRNFLLETDLEQAGPYLLLVLVWLAAGFALLFQLPYF
jgi:hypothetical protein